MAKSSSASSMKSSSSSTIRPEDYSHSPVHYAVAIGDHKTLTRLVSTLPRLTDPSQIHTESDSLAQEQLADQISSVVDRRDVPHRETPLHLAVRLNDPVSARTLASAGADVSLQNAAGWNPLQEAVCNRSSEVALILLRLHHRAAWSKWRRRLPRLVAVLRRMRDFYMEISFHFESSIVPFVGKIAPSDTYKIWKRDGNLRADTSLAGFDGLKIQRADQSFLFLGDGDKELGLSSGSLLVLNRDEKKIFDAFENADSPISESDVAGFWSQTSVYRPGMDVTKAELVGRMNWRRQERTENVGEWKAKVFEIHNVVFSFRSRKVAGDLSGDVIGDEQISPLELDEDSEEGFLVAENPNLGFSDRRRHSSFVREDRDWISVGRKSVDVPAPPLSERRRLSTSAAPTSAASAAAVATAASVAPPSQPSKEREYVKSLRPSVWLTEQFPLKTEEILPLLDILANKVKAVRRLRELLTTKFPPGTFPVKVAIPVVPTVRVMVTFTKFVDLQPPEQFFTPCSSPRNLLSGRSVGGADQPKTQQQQQKENNNSLWSTSSTSWLRRSNSTVVSKQNQRSTAAHQTDPFVIPSDYTWTSIDDTKENQKIKKSKSTRKTK